MNRLSHRLFAIGVWMKGIDGLLEAAGGVLVLLVKKSAVAAVVFLLTQQELLEDPHDVVANWMRRSVEHLTTNAQMFGGAYLVAHGAINIFLAASLLRNRLWSYPAAIAVLCVFIGYQVYRITLLHSPVLTIVTALDAAIVLLILHEYKAVRGRQA